MRTTGDLVVGQKQDGEEKRRQHQWCLVLSAPPPPPPPPPIRKGRKGTLTKTKKETKTNKGAEQSRLFSRKKTRKGCLTAYARKHKET